MSISSCCLWCCCFVFQCRRVAVAHICRGTAPHRYSSHVYGNALGGSLGARLGNTWGMTSLPNELIKMRLEKFGKTYSRKRNGGARLSNPYQRQRNRGCMLAGMGLNANDKQSILSGMPDMDNLKFRMFHFNSTMQHYYCTYRTRHDQGTGLYMFQQTSHLCVVLLGNKAAEVGKERNKHQRIYARTYLLYFGAFMKHASAATYQIQVCNHRWSHTWSHLAPCHLYKRLPYLLTNIIMMIAS